MGKKHPPRRRWYVEIEGMVLPAPFGGYRYKESAKLLLGEYGKRARLVEFREVVRKGRKK